MRKAAPVPEIFRVQLRPFFILCARLGTLVALASLAIAVVKWMRGRAPLNVSELAGAVASGLLVASVAALLFYVAKRALPVGISPEALFCTDGAGSRCAAPWSSLVSVRRVRFLGLEYLYIRSNAVPRELVLPLFLEERRRFGSLVDAYAGEASVLACALRDGAQASCKSLDFRH